MAARRCAKSRGDRRTVTQAGDDKPAACSGMRHPRRLQTAPGASAHAHAPGDLFAGGGSRGRASKLAPRNAAWAMRPPSWGQRVGSRPTPSKLMTLKAQVDQPKRAPPKGGEMSHLVTRKHIN